MAETLFPPRKKTGPWTAREVQELKRYLGASNREVIARILGRTVEEVERQILELGRLKTDSEWSRREIAEFKKLYGTRTDEDLALVFARPVAAIRELAERCLLAKDKAFVRKLRGEAATRMPRWSEDVPGYGFVLGCRAFSLEESHDFKQAEPMGRRAVEMAGSEGERAPAGAGQHDPIDTPVGQLQSGDGIGVGPGPGANHGAACQTFLPGPFQQHLGQPGLGVDRAGAADEPKAEPGGGHALQRDRQPEPAPRRHVRSPHAAAGCRQPAELCPKAAAPGRRAPATPPPSRSEAGRWPRLGRRHRASGIPAGAAGA